MPMMPELHVHTEYYDILCQPGITVKYPEGCDPGIMGVKIVRDESIPRTSVVDGKEEQVLGWWVYPPGVKKIPHPIVIVVPPPARPARIADPWNAKADKPKERLVISTSREGDGIRIDLEREIDFNTLLSDAPILRKRWIFMYGLTLHGRLHITSRELWESMWIYTGKREYGERIPEL